MKIKIMKFKRICGWFFIVAFPMFNGGICVDMAGDRSLDVDTIRITKDITWTAKDSPYRIKGKLIIEKGASLTIEPGVTVYFDTTFHSYWGGFPSKIFVKGSLYAEGTNDKKIVFNSIEKSLRWTGIESDSCTNVTLVHCVVDNAILPLKIANSQKIYVCNSVFYQKNKEGLGSTGQSGIMIYKSKNAVFNRCLFNLDHDFAIYGDDLIFVCANCIFNNFHFVCPLNFNTPSASISFTIKNNVFYNTINDSVYILLPQNSLGEFKYNCIYSKYFKVKTGIDCCGNLEGRPDFSGTGKPDTGKQIDANFNVYGNPMFKDSLFNLDTNSICIDAGDPGPSFVDSNGTRNDIGIYGGMCVPQ